MRLLMVLCALCATRSLICNPLTPMRRVPTTTYTPVLQAPSLRDQMAAYIASVKERGIELTADQKKMIEEFEADDELLDQTGRIDFTKDGTVPPGDDGSRLYQPQGEYSGPPPTPPPSAPPVPPAPAPVAAPAPAPAVGVAAASPAAVRMWQMQQRERGATAQLLRKRLEAGVSPRRPKAEPSHRVFASFALPATLFK